MILERLRGCLAALGRDPDWYRFFDTSTAGMRRSFLPALLTLPAFAIIALAVEAERARILEQAPANIPWAPFSLIMLSFLVAFPFVAVISSTLFQKAERWPAWLVVRHWSVLFLAWSVALGFALYLRGAIGFAIANVYAFAAWMSLLVLDIRLASKIGGLGLGASVLVGSIITTLGLSLILAALLLYLSG